MPHVPHIPFSYPEYYGDATFSRWSLGEPARHGFGMCPVISPCRHGCVDTDDGVCAGLMLEAGSEWGRAVEQCEHAEVFNPTESMTVRELLAVLAPICATLPGDKHVEFLATRMEATGAVEPLSPKFCRATMIKCATRVLEEADRFLNYRVRWQDQCTGVRMEYGTEPCTRNELVHYCTWLWGWCDRPLEHPDDLALDTLIHSPHMDERTSGCTTSRRDMTVPFGGEQVTNFLEGVRDGKIEW